MPEEPIAGSLLTLFLFDVSDEIRLAELRRVLNAPDATRKPAFRQPAPEYVQFASPPVMEQIEDLEIGGGPWIGGQIAYYDYGVVSLKLAMPFEGSWQDLIVLSARWMNDAELESKARELLQRRLAGAAAALVNPYADMLSEDYFIIHLHTVGRAAGAIPTADLIERHGHTIAQIVRGEVATFSPTECAEILESSMSYYGSDLVVTGWSAALVYDTPERAAPSIQLLEYANTQLLAFRHYGAVLTALLARVYRSFERRGG